MPATILIVEDDEELQDLCAAMLADLDCQITRVYDGGQALERLDAQKPDLILLDILLDEMSGDELFERMKSDPRFCDVQVVIISVLSKERCQHLLDIDPRTAYLRKPFRKAQLVEAVLKGLEGRDGKKESHVE